MLTNEIYGKGGVAGFERRHGTEKATIEKYLISMHFNVVYEFININMHI